MLVFQSVQKTAVFSRSIQWLIYGHCTHTGQCRNQKSQQWAVFSHFTLPNSVTASAFLSRLLWRILDATGPPTAVGRGTPSGLWVSLWSQSHRRQQQRQFWRWGFHIGTRANAGFLYVEFSASLAVVHRWCIKGRSCVTLSSVSNTKQNQTKGARLRKGVMQKTRQTWEV